MRSAWLGLALAVACGGGGDDRAPAMPDEGGASTGGKKPAVTAGTTSGDAGDAGAGANTAQGGASDGGTGDGGTGLVLQIGGAPEQAPPGVCVPEMKLSTDSAEQLGASAVTLLSITSDELSVAFTTGTAGSLVLHVADRASITDELVEVAVTLPEGFDAESGVSLSGDGHKLVVVMTDHSGFAELSRAARGDAFTAEGDFTAFARINALEPMSGHSVGWPVLSNDGKTLYFVSYFGQALVNQSERGKDGVFDIGTEIDPFTLGGADGEYKLLSGLSADQRAIFFFDEATQHAGALFRSAPAHPSTTPSTTAYGAAWPRTPTAIACIRRSAASSSCRRASSVRVATS